MRPSERKIITQFQPDRAPIHNPRQEWTMSMIKNALVALVAFPMLAGGIASAEKLTKAEKKDMKLGIRDDMKATADRAKANELFRRAGVHAQRAHNHWLNA